ncbi:MAG: hypothetical protein ACRD26_12890 [Vicinamibacterales bacterium]
MRSDPASNGAALAAFLGAGIGTFAMGFFVLLNEAGILVAPSLYGPAGGVSGRTTFAVAAWLAVWILLHRRWRNRRIEPGRVYGLTLLLVSSGIVATFPPVWRLF